MPNPSDFDSESDFMAACVPEVEGEGKPHDQAVAQCLGMWANREDRSMSDQTFSRSATLVREDGAPAGAISGILATDGEASDGHILNIAGGDVAAGIPLLFGHDDWSGERNLGSWTAFRRSKESGLSILRGSAQIEMTGPRSEWRQDVAHMVEKGHISGLSIRWEPTAPPVRRVNLPSNHPAFVSSEEAQGAERFGLYFEKWRALEGSVVTLGADREAIIGRALDQSVPEGARSLWASLAEHLDEKDRERSILACFKRFPLDELEEIEFHGERFWVPADLAGEIRSLRETQARGTDAPISADPPAPTPQPLPVAPAPAPASPSVEVPNFRELAEELRNTETDPEIRSYMERMAREFHDELREKTDGLLYRTLGRIPR